MNYVELKAFEEVSITCAAAHPVCSLLTSAPNAESTEEEIPAGVFRALARHDTALGGLYLGCKDGRLLRCSLSAALPGGGGAEPQADLRVAARGEAMLAAPSAAEAESGPLTAAAASPSSPSFASYVPASSLKARAVTALYAHPSAGFVVGVCGGLLFAASGSSLRPLAAASPATYWGAVPTVLWCHSGGGAGGSITASCERVASRDGAGWRPHADAPLRLAVAADLTVHFVECRTARASAAAAATPQLVSSATVSGKSSTPLQVTLPASAEAIQCLDSFLYVLFAANGACRVYSLRDGGAAAVLSVENAACRGQRPRLALLPGCCGLDAAERRGTRDDAARRSSVGAEPNAWPSAVALLGGEQPLVFRCGSGGGGQRVHTEPLSAASGAAAAVTAARELHAMPPFLFAVGRSREAAASGGPLPLPLPLPGTSSGGASSASASAVSLGSCFDAQPWPGGPCAVAAKRAHTFLPHSAPGGLVAVSAHHVGLVAVRPFEAQVNALLLSRRYDTAVHFFYHCYPRQKLLQTRKTLAEVLEHFYKVVAGHALGEGQHVTAFTYLALTDTPVADFMRLLPEFQEAADTLQRWRGADAGEQQQQQQVHLRRLRLSYSDTTAPYDAFYARLQNYYRAHQADADEGVGDGAAGGDASAAESRQERRRVLQTVEFLLFLMQVMQLEATRQEEEEEGAGARPPPLLDAGKTAVTAASLERFVLQSRCLPVGLCAALTDPDAPSAAYPTACLRPTLLILQGEFAAALEECRAKGYIVTAAEALRRIPADGAEEQADDGALSLRDRLYMQHVPWILEADAEAGLALLMPAHEGQAPSEPVPPVPVPVPVCLALLEGGPAPLLCRYLHALIFAAGNADGFIHTSYALTLADMAAALRDELGQRGFRGEADGAGEVPLPAAAAGREWGVLGRVRRALLRFLAWPGARYDGAAVLARAVRAGLREEAVALRRRGGDHLGALRTLVYEMDDPQAAVDYCAQLAAAGGAGAPAPAADDARQDAGQPGSGVGALEFPSRACLQSLRESADALVAQTARPTADAQRDGETVDSDAPVAAPAPAPPALPRGRDECFYVLLQILLTPPAGQRARVAEAARLLAGPHGARLDPLAIASLVPGQLPARLLAAFFTRSLQTGRLARELAAAEGAAAEAALREAACVHALLQQRCVLIDEARRCDVCGQPLGAAGLPVVFPNLKVVHYRCQSRLDVDPERGVPFRGML